MAAHLRLFRKIHFLSPIESLEGIGGEFFQEFFPRISSSPQLFLFPPTARRQGFVEPGGGKWISRNQAGQACSR
jgi:hypothetical protein